MHVTKELIDEINKDIYVKAMESATENVEKASKEMFSIYSPGATLDVIEISSIYSVAALEASAKFTVEYVSKLLLRLFGGDIN